VERNAVLWVKCVVVEVLTMKHAALLEIVVVVGIVANQAKVAV